MPRMLTLQFGLFTFSLWLGCYLLVTDVVRRRLWYAGMGLIAYALAIGWSIFVRSGVVSFNGALLLIAIAAMLWMATMIRLLPEQEAAYYLLWKIWRFGLLPIMMIAGFFLLLRTDLTQLWRILIAVDVIVPLIIVAAAVMGNRSSDFSGRVHWLFAVVTALFVFSLLALPIATSRNASIWILLSGGADLALLALIVTAYDAWDQGERLFLDFVRSLAGAGGVALAFASAGDIYDARLHRRHGGHDGPAAQCTLPGRCDLYALRAATTHIGQNRLFCRAHVAPGTNPLEGHSAGNRTRRLRFRSAGRKRGRLWQADPPRPQQPG